MSNRNANVWEMAFNASLQFGETKRQNNRFILNCFFKITFLMIRKNWAHSHNFRDIVELVADLVPKKHPCIYLLHRKIQNTFHHCMSQGALKLSNYIKQPLLENMRSNLCSFYMDETSDVTSIDQLAIYATFLRNQSISEHFLGLIPISKEVLYICT